MYKSAQLSEIRIDAVFSLSFLPLLIEMNHNCRYYNAEEV